MANKYCPRCYSELPEVANYCPVCGKKLVDVNILEVHRIGKTTKKILIKGLSNKALVLEEAHVEEVSQ